MTDKLNFFSKIPAKNQRTIMFAGLVVVCLAILMSVLQVMNANQPKTNARKHAESNASQDFLSGGDTRNLGIEGLSVKIKEMSDNNSELKRALSSLSDKYDSMLEKAKERDANHQKEIATMKAEIVTTQKNTKSNIREQIDSRLKDNKVFQKVFDKKDSDNAIYENKKTEELDNFKRTSDKGPRQRNNNVKIREISEAQEKPKATVTKNKRANISNHLSSGAIISGVLINGIDAPTSLATKQDPSPALLRIKKLAILPNRFRMDIRECFVVLSGYGELSSERAQIRAERISCTMKSGDVLERSLEAFAVGEDGKTGVRGRVVSKRSAMLARSLMAGFMSGISTAIKPQPIPGFLTNPTSKQEYVVPEIGDVGKVAAMSGVSNAMDRLAKFYVEMAKDIYPVIEVDAGRSLELIVTRGAKFEIGVDTDKEEKSRG